jgi:hypothetical protein
MAMKAMSWSIPELILKRRDIEALNMKNAMVPTPFLKSDGNLRVFITLCDQENIGRIYFVDVEMPSCRAGPIIGPVLDVGRPGDFDEHGVVVAQIVGGHSNSLLMYYSGFRRFKDWPYEIYTGLAISVDGGQSFKKFSAHPILPQVRGENLFRCAPHVLWVRGVYKMWYVAGSEWCLVQGRQVPQYFLHVIESSDGFVWNGPGTACMTLRDGEHGIGRPWIEFGEGIFRLYYSIRNLPSGLYSLGYAESYDGEKWFRCDEALGLSGGLAQFDCNAMCYSALVEVNRVTYLLYNGNSYGFDGFAITRRIDDCRILQ